MTDNYINALVRLIDDPDENIYSQVKKRISSIGSAVIPILEHSRDDDFDLLFQNRIDTLIREIQFEETKIALQNWVEGEEKSLLEGSLIIAQYQYPDLDKTQLRSLLEEVRKAIWLELSPASTAFEKVKIINKILFDKFEFQGNSTNFHAPIHSYINTVCELKIGNPLSLSVVYSVVAEMLEIPIYGVNLPNHFILAYMDEMQINAFVGNTNKYGVLFYIDAFSKGKILDDKTVCDYLKQLNYAPDRTCFEPCSNSQILKCMLANLSETYRYLGQTEKIKDIGKLKNIFP